MSAATDLLVSHGCAVVEEWFEDDDWEPQGAAIGVSSDGRWAFCDWCTEGTCPHCYADDAGLVVWCHDEGQARAMLANHRKRCARL